VERLPVTVTLLRLTSLPAAMPPPEPWAVLFEIVLSAMVSEGLLPSERMAPPWPAPAAPATLALPVRIVRSRVRSPLLWMAPPPAVDRPLRNVTSCIWTVTPLGMKKMPPAAPPSMMVRPAPSPIRTVSPWIWRLPLAGPVPERV
jgi:hypothetical protein